MSAKGTLQINTAITDAAAASGPILLLEGNPQRVYFILSAKSAGSQAYIGIDGSGLLDSCFTAVIEGVTQYFLRKDFGSLVACEIWASNGVGGPPGTDLIVCEGVLIGD